MANNSASDTIWVTVSTAVVPEISSPADIAYEEGTTGHLINWTVGDRHTGTYEIYNNSIKVDYGSWANGTLIWDVDGLSTGTYNFTMVVRDASSNCVADTVWVTVMAAPTTTPPDLPELGLTALIVLAIVTALGVRRKRR